MGLDNPVHILLLLLVVLLVFGAKRLPEIGRSLGTGMRDFKTSLSGEAQPAQVGVLATTETNPQEITTVTAPHAAPAPQL